VIAPDCVSAVLVTRGDCDMTPITGSLRSQGIDDIIVWDNSVREDMGIYGRYAAIAEAKHDVVVTQDDDLIVSCYAGLLAGYEPGVFRCNYAEPWDIPWPSVGSVFDANLPGEAFARYYESYPHDHLFTHRICDAVFALLTPMVDNVYFGHEDLPHGFHPGRVSTSPNWYQGDRLEAQRRCREISEAVSA
jgi:hypothetical protein